MAKTINAQVSGGIPVTVAEAHTVDDVRKELGLEDTYKAVINGQEASMTDTLEDFNHVMFTEKVKGNK